MLDSRAWPELQNRIAYFALITIGDELFSHSLDGATVLVPKLIPNLTEMEF